MEKKRKITVSTKSNGYALDIEGTEHGFFYFDEQSLVDGFMYHVGLKENSPANKENIRRLVAAAAKWADNEGLVKRLDIAEQRVETLESKNDSLRKALKRMEKRSERYKAMLSQYDKKAADECSKEDASEDVSCAYLRDDDGCRWCELGIISCNGCTEEMIKSLAKNGESA